MEAIKTLEITPFKVVFTWMQRIHSREQLKSLNDHVLTDIGLTRQEVEREIRKPFWKA